MRRTTREILLGERLRTRERVIADSSLFLHSKSARKTSLIKNSPRTRTTRDARARNNNYDKDRERKRRTDSMSFLTEDQVKCYELLQSAKSSDFIDVSFLRIVHQTVASAFPDVLVKRRKKKKNRKGGDGDDVENMNDTDRLNEVFLVCVQIGLTSVIVHFIDEISNDANCVSADAVEARLRDGENIFQFMVDLMEEEKESMMEAVKRKNSSSSSNSKTEEEEKEEEGALARAMVTFQCARRVFETLGAEDVGSRRHNSSSSSSSHNIDNNSDNIMIEKLNALRDESIDLANKAEATMWAVEEGLLKSGHLGNKFSGVAKWSNEVKERRANAKTAYGYDDMSRGDDGDECCLFVDVLLRYLKEKSGNADVASYPFKSVPDALNAIWGGRGGSSEDEEVAQVVKKSLFLYYILDAGLPWKEAPARYARNARIGSKTYSEIRLASLLDESWTFASEPLKDIITSEALPNCATLSGRFLPLQFVKVVHLRGETAAALRTLRARDRNDFTFESVEKATLDVEVRIELGLVAEAFLCAKEQLSLAVRSMAATKGDEEEEKEELIVIEQLANILTMKIAEYCADVRQLDQIIAMPLQNTALNGSMERAFLSWLWENKIRDDVSAEHTILYFLQRGRTAEAVEAYARILDLERRGGAIAWGKAKKETIEMLEERAKDLPVVVQQMSTDNLGTGSVKVDEKLGREMERMKTEDKLSADVTILEAVSAVASSAPDFVLRAAGDSGVQPSPFLRPLTTSPASGDEFPRDALRASQTHRLARSPFDVGGPGRRQSSKSNVDQAGEDANMMQVADVGANNVSFARRPKLFVRSEAAIPPPPIKKSDLPPLPSLSPLAANTNTSAGPAGVNITAPSPTRASPRTRLSKGTRRT